MRTHTQDYESERGTRGKEQEMRTSVTHYTIQGAHHETSNRLRPASYFIRRVSVSVSMVSVCESSICDTFKKMKLVNHQPPVEKGWSSDDE